VTYLLQVKRKVVLYVIRQYPKIEIELHEHHFTVYDAKRDDQPLAFEYDDLMSVQRLPSRPDWLGTALASAVTIFLGELWAVDHPEKLWLRFRDEKSNKKVPLKNCNMAVTNNVIIALRDKIGYHRR
jgi:hypothetical protein